MSSSSRTSGVLVVAVFEIVERADFFDGAEDLDHQHAVMGDDGAAAFADDVRVRDLLGVADIADVINDVVGVFLEGVIGGAVEGRAAAVVIHAESAADVDVLDGEAHFVELGVEPRGLLNGFFYGKDVRHLRADVKMEELEAMAEVLGFEHFGGGEQFGGAEAELGVFAAALGPFAGALAEETGADADERLDAKLLRERDDVAEFLEFFDDQDHLLAELQAEDGHLDEAGVLVAVADDEAAHLVLQREAGEELRLAADLQAEVEGLAGVEDFLHDFAELVDLDGKNAAIGALVIEFRDGIAEGEVDGLDAVAEDVLEADEHRAS